MVVMLAIMQRNAMDWCYVVPQNYNCGEGSCSNRQSAIMWERWLAKSSYNFYSGWKSLIHCSSCSKIYCIWGRGWLKTSEYHHMGEGSLKLLKNVIWYLNVPHIPSLILHDYTKKKCVLCNRHLCSHRNPEIDSYGTLLACWF